MFALTFAVYFDKKILLFVNVQLYYESFLASWFLFEFDLFLIDHLTVLFGRISRFRTLFDTLKNLDSSHSLAIQTRAESHFLWSIKRVRSVLSDDFMKDFFLFFLNPLVYLNSDTDRVRDNISEVKLLKILCALKNTS